MNQHKKKETCPCFWAGFGTWFLDPDFRTGFPDPNLQATFLVGFLGRVTGQNARAEGSKSAGHLCPKIFIKKTTLKVVYPWHTAAVEKCQKFI